MLVPTISSRVLHAGSSRAGRAGHVSALAALLLALHAVGGCATVPEAERLLSLQPGGTVAATSAPCGKAGLQGAAAPAALAVEPLRVVSWNLHKGEDAGWQRDLARLASSHDLVLLQEAVLTSELRGVIEGAGLRWQMAGAFAVGGVERGVMLASREAPLTVCTLRSFEPLFPLPKSAIVGHYRIGDGTRTLAVANLHGVNFSLGLKRFREQVGAVIDELARHSGPAILGGDFNTWSDERHEVMLELAQRAGLSSVPMTPDGRRRTFGRLLDHFFVRGLTVHAASSPELKSSDHNPILVTLTLGDPSK